MASIFITGSSDGLGLAAGASLIKDGHTVVLHARNEARAAKANAALRQAEAVLVGDLASRAQTLNLAERANELGSFDAVIHNAGVGYQEPYRLASPEGHSHVLAINVLAPYILTAKMLRPRRLIYLSSAAHVRADATFEDIDWIRRPWDGSHAYSESKLFDTILAAAVARRWPDVLSNSVDPGWVPTKMGGTAAPDDLALGHVTQTWLAASDDQAAMVTGRYFYHQRAGDPKLAATDPEIQDALVHELEALTGVQLPPA
jgi:NAD(P)-dependent dehydrogenase (short-subunit alcohol dehydrogenase family)